MATPMNLRRAKVIKAAASWIAVFAMVVAPQTFQPAPASATTATIADGTNNCQVPVASSTITIDSTSTSISLVGSRCVVKFLAVGSYTITMPAGVASLDYLVVGGGGGGGSGGGGAGGVLQGANYAVTAGNTYSVSVGAGGAGGRGGANSAAAPHSTNGDQSLFATVTALGGGAGGEGNRSPDHAGNGASGGGARFDCTNISCIGLGTPGQGTNGAASTHGGYGGGAGGGGAGGAGGNTVLYNIGGKGGDGVVSSITGTATYYGGGGGGGINSNDNAYCGLRAPGTSDANKYCNGNTPVTNGGGDGGLGGGGKGSSWGYTGGAQGDISIGGKANGSAGTPNTGGGGGGIDPEDAYAYPGGSGIVVISYVSPANFRAVTFNSNNGSGSTSTQWVQSGVATALQTNPYTYTGYVFQGWNTAVDGTGTTYTNLANITTTSAITLYAQWRAGVTHTVTFDANGGTGTQAAQVAGQATNLNATQFSRTGYTFSGWNTLANGTGYKYLDQAVFSFAQDATLYAQWTIIIVPHSVSFYGNGATSGTTSSQTASATQALTLNGFERTGYNFLGWNTNNAAGTATYLDGQNYSFAADLSLYAIWVAQAPNVITFNGNSSTSGSMATQTASSNTVLSANAFARTGYTFLSWNTAANGSGVSYQSSYTYSFATSITLYAIWGQNYTITYDGNTNTAGSVPTTQSSYVGGSAQTLQGNTGSLAKTGYLLSGWNTAANGTGTAYAIGQNNVTFSGNVTLYAQWLGATYVILYTGNGNTSGSTPSSQSYVFGSSGITLAANSGTLARTGYTFAGWNTAPDRSGTAFAVGATGVTFAQDTVLFAAWTANETSVTYVYNGSDGGDVGATAVFLTGGSALVLPTPTKTGYSFGGWYSDALLTTSVGAAGASYSPSTASPTLSLYAKWTANTYAVTYAYNSATGGNSTTSDSFTTGGSSITLPTPTRTGYTFGGWYSDSGFTIAIGAAGATYAPSSVATAITAYAKWTANVYNVIYTYNGADAGNSTADATFTSGGVAITLPTPTRTGYTFAGWYSDGGLTASIGSAGASYSPSGSTTSLATYAKWTAGTYITTYNYGGADGGNTDATSSFITGGTAIRLPSPTRSHFHFDGWYDASTSGALVGLAGAAISPSTAQTLYARWTQDSLYGIGSSSKIGSLTVSNGLGTQYTATGSSNSVNVNLPSGSLPDGTVLDVYLLNDSSSAQSLIGGSNSFIVSLVISWLALDGTVPTTTAGTPIVVTIANSSIKAGASIYRLIGGVAEFAGIASQDGVAQVSITDDPGVVIAATVPTAPLSATATLAGTTATITWTAPSSTGGADISSYLVTSSTGQSCTTQTLTCDITSLSYGVAQTFTVQALNSIGVSVASSATSSVTAQAPQVSAGGGGVVGTPVQPPVVIVPNMPDPATWSAPIPSQQVLSGQQVMVTSTGITPIAVSPNATNTGLIASAGDWTIALDIDRPTGSAPTVIDSKLQLFAGETVAFKGKGLVPNSSVKVWFYSTPQMIGTFNIKADGSFSATLKVPVGLPLGNHTLVLQSVGEDLKVQSEQFPVTLQAQVGHKFNVVFTAQATKISKATSSKLKTFATSLAAMVNVSVAPTCHVNSSASKAQASKICTARVAQIKRYLKARNVLATFKKPLTAKASRPSSAQTVRLTISAISH